LENNNQIKILNTNQMKILIISLLLIGSLSAQSIIEADTIKSNYIELSVQDVSNSLVFAKADWRNGGLHESYNINSNQVISTTSYVRLTFKRTTGSLTVQPICIVDSDSWNEHRVETFYNHAKVYFRDANGNSVDDNFKIVCY